MNQPDLKTLAIKLATEGPHKTLPTPRQIQILFNGVYIVKTTKAVFVWEHPFYPQLYIPYDDIKPEANATFTEDFKSDSGDVLAHRTKFKVGDKETDKIITFPPDLPGKGEDLAGLVKIDFKSMDQWFEEDTPIFVHPKDPFKRIDILSSTRPIRVSIAGKVVASTTNSMHLYETGLPVRFYLPLTSIDASVLRPSDLVTECPYKGKAEYYSVEIEGKMYENVVWFYRTPTLESARVEGLCCFYNEKVDIELDGERLERPVTHFGGGGKK